MAGSGLRSVWFDCDSTLTAVEGIDEIARLFRPHLAAAVADLTDRAMRGEVPLDAVYGERLRLLAPTRSEVEAVGRRYVEQAVADAHAVVGALQRHGLVVGIVSGGLRPAVLHLAAALGIAAGHVHAVAIDFDQTGAYSGFDRASPLTRAGGKREVMAGLPAALHPLMLVGDGVTDLEAAPAVARFVGFGGVVRRPAVAAACRDFVAGPGLGAVVELALAAEPRKIDPSRLPDRAGPFTT